MSSLPSAPAATPPPAQIKLPHVPATGTSSEQLLWWIVEATSGHTGDAFFASLVSHLALALQLKYVFITECLDSPVTRVRTLARWAGTGLTPNVEFNLDGTACKDTIVGKRVCFVPDNVQELFWQERSFDRIGYYGIPIFDTDGESVIGHLAFYDNKRMEDQVFDNPIFHIFANRAAAELQRRRAEDASRAHLQQLAHVARVGSMGELASAIAHEVNQPLAAITSYARACEMLVGRAQGLPDDMREAVAGILAQAERAAAITHRLRGFLRDSESMSRPVNVNRMALESVELAKSDARQRGIALETRFDVNVQGVLGDPVQLQQVVFNLIRNALDAHDGHAATSRWVMVGTASTSEGAQISVTDNGPGIAPGAHDKLFNPFFTTKSDGMGIGLSLARTIVQHCGGSLMLDSSVDTGARFVITLPAATSPPKVAPSLPA